jgi:hypothetical protein
MITNLDFLKKGGLYPPTTEVERLSKYARYRALFDSKVADAYSRMIKDSTTNGTFASGMETIFSNPRITNYARAITKKTVDLWLSKKPSLLSTTNKGDMDLKEIQYKTKCWAKVKRAGIDMSRFGNGYIREYNKIPRTGKLEALSAGEAGLNTISPELVTMVVNPLDKEDITAYVIGWVDEVTTTTAPNITNTEYYLTVEIHGKGHFEYRRFRVSAPILNLGGVKQYTIEEEVTPAKMKGKRNTGLKGFAIKPLIGFTTSDSPYEGLSDYDMFDSLMIDLCERISQLSEVFAKHGNPSMQGSPELMSQDEDGNPVFYTGEYYPISQGQEKLSYLTWDAKSKEVLEYCNQILEQIFMLADMGDGSIFGFTTKTNSNFSESGKGIRMKMASPLMKVQSIISDNEDTLIEMICDCAEIMGKKNIKPETIEIKWKDGLPIDWVEETNMFNSRVAAKTESIVYGLERRFGLTAEQAEDELKQIIKESKMLDNTEKTADNNNNSGVQVEERETMEKRVDAENAGTVDMTKKVNN